MDINFKKLLKDTISKISNTKKALWFLGDNAFSVILLIVLLEIAFGEFLFYKYVFLPNNQQPEITNVSFQFKENVYQSISTEWQNRDKKFNDYSQKEYTSPF